jgi:ankyrin repeat protein
MLRSLPGYLSLYMKAIFLLLFLALECLATNSSTAAFYSENMDQKLLNAAQDGDLDTVNRLLADGADKDTKDNDLQTPLHYAARSGSIKVIKALLIRSADRKSLDASRRTPLHVATWYGHLEVAQELFGRDYKKSALLHYVARKGHLNAVKTL